ncbi:molybdenum cofactor guanylyltransferase [Tumidithrix elongata RA019]|uniref:Probable molybdenum cofactor guanylyltransferase n=1 Tax=Tumidithrix elongata BACA0141 TaxID=2716417 RepID=A0AAW9Q0E5_9CYAN|nr:molybdenum cofactor guanylyltransferase [Tumidithrix elongata RA019]
MKIAAIALAGGQSSRMGQDKALVEIDGVPLLQRICTAAQQAGSTEIYIVTGWQERYQKLALPSGSKFVHDRDRQGALFGFALGLAEVNQASNPLDWVLLLACDLPHLDGAILQTWANQLSDLPEKAIAYLPRHVASSSQNSRQNFKYQPEWEPLCGFYRSSCLKNLEEFIETGGSSFQRWLSQNNVEAIGNVDSQMLLNCNTPIDLLRVKTVK